MVRVLVHGGALGEVLRLSFRKKDLLLFTLKHIHQLFALVFVCSLDSG